MERRSFLRMSVAALMALPMMVLGRDFRKEKPDAWTAKTLDDAIKKVYGDITPEEKGIKLKTPEVANNGGQIPIGIKSKIPAKTVAIFQDVNPEALVGIYDVMEGQPVDYLVKIKMKKSGTVTIILEGVDGKFYSAKSTFKVALGGCEG
jgi:sulfur-oxidizing protein SoxY